MTDNHLIWSATRQAFVAAGELAVGEELSTLGGTSRIASIAVRENREQVYNLEVHSEHVYCVGATGALVHNACPDNFVYQLVDADGIPVYYGIAADEANLARRLARHGADPAKAGLFKGQQVIAKGLTRAEARSLETSLIDTARRAGRFLLNEMRSIEMPKLPLPSTFDPTVTHLPPGYFSQ